MAGAACPMHRGAAHCHTHISLETEEQSGSAWRAVPFHERAALPQGVQFHKSRSARYGTTTSSPPSKGSAEGTEHNCLLLSRGLGRTQHLP